MKKMLERENEFEEFIDNNNTDDNNKNNDDCFSKRRTLKVTTKLVKISYFRCF